LELGRSLRDLAVSRDTCVIPATRIALDMEVGFWAEIAIVGNEGVVDIVHGAESTPSRAGGAEAREGS
jgi:hypothetical protein